MAATAIKIKNIKQKSNQPSENVGPGQSPLYFKNVGLFSDPYLMKLNEPTKDDFLNKHWETEALPEFNEAYEWMLSTWEEMKDVLPTLSEAQLENKWIQPILEKLGWEYEVQDRLKKWGKTEIPDYSLFESKKTYLKAQGCKTDESYFEHVLAVADAKQMGISLDGSKLDKSNPSYQIIWYQQITGRTWGILSDGRYWRLYSLRSKSKFTSYYEVNIEKLLSDRDDEQFKYFYNFFRKDSLTKLPNSNQCFLDVVFEKGERYAKEVETKLKDRAFVLAEHICQGFIQNFGSKSEIELDTVYSNSLAYLFRLLFILNCEAKGLLRVEKQSDYYVYSLRNLCLQLKSEFESNTKWSSQPKSYNYITGLFSLLENGDGTIGIYGFGKELFLKMNQTFFKKNGIPDNILNPILIDLAFAETTDEKDLRLIDYKRLSADHIGSLFEGLLEFHLEPATKGKAEEFHLVNSKGQRKSTGSYYTPDFIVDYIVRNTLDPVIGKKSVSEIMKLRIADPAMGSGHFLLGTIRYLEEIILCKMSEGDKSLKLEPSEIRWQILHNCIYGIDINPLAVELAKLSLWIYTAREGYELEPLSDQLFIANSLIDVGQKNLPEILKKDPKVDLSKVEALRHTNGRFDAVVGNPPYAPISDPELYEFYSKAFPNQEYQLDLYLLFLERYEKFLIPKGQLGIIVSNTWMQSLRLRKIRSYLCNQYHWKKILHSKDKLFDATVDTHVLIFTLGQDKKMKPVQIEILNNGEVTKLHEIPPESLATNGDAINILTDVGQSELFEKIKGRCKPLSTEFDVYSGITPFEKGKGSPPQTAKIMETKPFVVEGPKPVGSDWVPLLRGSLIRRFQLLWKKDYWVKYGPWLAAPRDPKIFSAPTKIMVRQTGDSIIATKIGSGYIARKNLHIILPQRIDQDLNLVLGILNSKLIDFVYYNMNPEKGEALAEVKMKHIEALPLPEFSKLTADQTKVAKKISALVEEILKKQDSSKNAALFDDELATINDLVFELFGLSKSEIKIIEKFCDANRKGLKDEASEFA